MRKDFPKGGFAGRRGPRGALESQAGECQEGHTGCLSGLTCQIYTV
jgi:hypothetical protein